MTMKNRLFQIVMTVALLASIAGCQREEIIPDIPGETNSEVGVFGDFIKMKLNVVAPDPIKVGTKAVDPDGKGVQTMTLFCFDQHGLFISTATASIEQELDDIEAGGIFDAFIPNTTRIMHLVGNQNMTPFKEEDFRQKSEDEVMSILEGSAGMIIYWARVVVPENVNELYQDNASSAGRSTSQAILDWITIETNPETDSYTVGPEGSTKTYNGENNPIVLLRNQARVTVVSQGAETEAKDDKEWDGTYFKVTGFTVCNTQAFGTVAPYHNSYGFPTYKCTTYDPEYAVISNADGSNIHWAKENYITLPENKDKLSDIMDVSTAQELFIFESQNSSADPVDVIIKGQNIVNNTAQGEMYYKVSLTNDDGEQVLVRRNHHYEINIVGNLSYGVPTFAQALDAPATNNIWLSISDEVKSVQNASFRLTVDQTKIVVNADDIEDNNTVNLTFLVEKLGSEALNADDLSITWVEDDQRVSSTLNPDLAGSAVSFSTANGQGTITLNLNTLGDDVKREGTLLVKYGHLQRKIKVVTVKTQQFIPAWVSTEVYGAVAGDKGSGENVTLVFTIPETCPAELFPLNVLISVNDLDIRSESGQILPVIRRGESGYGTTDLNGDGTSDDFGYKYVYTVNKTGIHRLYMENIIGTTQDEVKYITLEAENFYNLQKPVTFTEEKNVLVVENMLSKNAEAGTVEAINYILVPQKRYAPITFNIAAQNASNAGVALATTDEFLLFSSNLDNYTDSDSRVDASQFDCSFKPYDEDVWGTGGRVFGFYPRTAISDGKFAIYMETNKAQSAEVVRVASNQKNSESVINENNNYNGQTFRSVTFELANYRPFRFAAQINGSGNFVDNDAVLAENATPANEVLDDIQFTYLPDQKVAVSFDITSFAAKNGENTVSVDPFGTGFEIYIDAPMLKLVSGDNTNIEGKSVAMFEKNADGSLPATVASKAKLEDLGNGKFVYRVDPDRETERAFWNNSAVKIADATGANQAGERKTIIFETKDIVSTGNITISSNNDQVVYHSKTFRVSNTPITGIIKYGTADVPAGQFISFTREFNGSRIGSMNVTEDGKYELKLRKEYEFYWINDPIKLITSIGGKYYSATIDSLEELYNNSNVVLTEEVAAE